MGLFKRFGTQMRSVMGQTQPGTPDLDALFAVPPAALTLESAMNYRPTGVGSVCFRAVEGGDFARTQAEVQQLLDADEGPAVEQTKDSFGFTWLTVRQDPSDLSALMTDLHAVNRSLEDNGYGPALLCSLVGFRAVTGDGSASNGLSLGLVYLYKRGSFYPFAPRGASQRDSALELQVRTALAGELPVEEDLSRWFSVWGAPGL